MSATIDPVDAAGTIDESWRQQPGSPVYVKDFSADLRDALANARQKREPEWSGTSASPGSFENPA